MQCALGGVTGILITLYLFTVTVTENSASEERDFRVRVCGLGKPGLWSNHGEAGATLQVPVLGGLLWLVVLHPLKPGGAITRPSHSHTYPPPRPALSGTLGSASIQVTAPLRSLAALSVIQLYCPSCGSVALYLPPSRAGIMGLWLEREGEQLSWPLR